MSGGLKTWCLIMVLTGLLLAGCSAILFESKQEDGQLSRVKLDTGESWDCYDDRPRYRFDRKKTYDDMSIMLKREATF